MAQQYLDKTGLTYLWSKLKSYFVKGNTGGVFYGTCPTATGTVEKAVTCDEFTTGDLKAGTIIVVSFSATNSGAVANLKLNVNNTGAKPIKYINNGTLGNLSSAGYLKASTEYPFYYDGANWVVWMNYNTTYSALSEADMKTGTATTARTITAARLKEAVEYHAPVTSVNGSTGDVTVSVPKLTYNHAGSPSEVGTIEGFEVTYDGKQFVVNTRIGGSSNSLYVLTESGTASDYYNKAQIDDLFTPTFCACDATTRTVLSNGFSILSTVVAPSDITSMSMLVSYLQPEMWFAWMNGTELEFARLSLSVNTSTSAGTLYLRGRTSIATGIFGVDSSWTVSALASDAEGVAY